MEVETQEDLEKPINGNLNNTQTESSNRNKKRDLSRPYSLRENPKKKTQKSPEESMKKKNLFCCQECGKGFRYEGSFSKHQKAHSSTKTKNQKKEEVNEEEEHMKSLRRSFSLMTKKKRSSRYKKTISVSTENGGELEAAEGLILLSNSSPKSVEAIDASNNPETSCDDSGCLSSKKLRKDGEFESRVFSSELKLVEDRSSGYGTSEEQASFLVDKQKQGKTGEFEYGLLSDEQKLREAGEFDESMEEGISRDELDQEKLEKGGEFGTGFSSNEQKSGGGDMECCDSDSEKKILGHQCKLCKKIFSSYQALGGHQTLHRHESVRMMSLSSVTVKKHNL